MQLVWTMCGRMCRRMCGWDGRCVAAAPGRRGKRRRGAVQSSAFRGAFRGASQVQTLAASAFCLARLSTPSHGSLQPYASIAASTAAAAAPFVVVLGSVHSRLLLLFLPSQHHHPRAHTHTLRTALNTWPALPTHEILRGPLTPPNRGPTNPTHAGCCHP